MLLERERLVVIDKPSGMLSVPGKGAEKADCAAARVRERYPWATGPLVVHRLDMDTSGVMVFALDAEAQRELSGQFERREVEKRYVALVEGMVEGDAGEIDAPIRLDVRARPFQIHDPVLGQRARTAWRVLGYEVDRTRVEFRPLTGRTHQLRVHAALARPEGLGHAIVGDVLYGAAGRKVYEALVRGEEPPELPPELPPESPPESPQASSTDDAGGAQRLMLHACWLRVKEPGSGKWLEVESGAGF